MFNDLQKIAVRLEIQGYHVAAVAIRDLAHNLREKRLLPEHSKKQSPKWLRPKKYIADDFPLVQLPPVKTIKKKPHLTSRLIH